MKRVIFTAAALMSAVWAVAQQPFTIVHPSDGARVRQTVRIDVPKTSVQAGEYIGVFLNGKFVEAIIPVVTPGSKFYTYFLDTKKVQIPDGPAKVELALYQDVDGQSRVLDRTSVQIVVDNYSSIKIPTKGLSLRYTFRPDTSLVYDADVKVLTQSLSNEQARRGGHAAEATLSDEHFRMTYSIDNAYATGDALLRMQAAPPAGQDYAVINTIENPAGRRYLDNEFAPIYMRVSNRGREQYGSIPPTAKFNGSGEIVDSNLFANFPLPLLPDAPVRPGDSWRSVLLKSNLDLTNFDTKKSFNVSLPARGEFLGVEWEMGHPCAKIRNVLEQSGGGIKIRDEEVFYFALDKGVILKETVRRVIREAGPGSAGAPAGGGGAQAPGGRAPAKPGGAPGTGGGGAADVMFPDGTIRQVARKPVGAGSSGGGTAPAGGGANNGGGAGATGGGVLGLAGSGAIILEITLVLAG